MTTPIGFSTDTPITIPDTIYYFIPSWDNEKVPHGNCIGSDIILNVFEGQSSSEGSCPSSIGYDGITAQALLVCKININTIKIYYDKYFEDNGIPQKIDKKQATNLCMQENGTVISK